MNEKVDRGIMLQWDWGMNKYTAHPIPPKNQIDALYFGQNKTQVEIGQHFGVTQKVVFRWFRALGIKARIAAKRDQRGSKNSGWKGDSIGYAALHLRVEAKYGKPRLCAECGTTTAKRYEWANISGKYLNVDDFCRLCRSCHAKFDGVIRNISCGNSR